jgi:phosphoglycerate dehydrogenase-like enzyme
VSEAAWAEHGAAFRDVAAGLEPVVLGDALLYDDALATLDVVLFSADVWLARNTSLMGAALRAPNLRWFHTFSTGVDHPVFQGFLDRGVRLTTSAGSSAAPIAQTVVMYLLALSRDLPGWLHAQREHRWDQRPFAELTGQAFGVVGLGPIGTAVARLGAALGMEVVGVRRTPTGDEPCTTWPLHRLDDLLAWADWVVLAVPLTPETHRLLDARRLGLMKPGARLVNVGRGQLVDEGALVEALRSGRLGGAGLDVFEIEPLPADSPLWDMPNVIITPHNAGTTAGSHRRAIDVFIDNLGRFVRGEPLRNEVTRVGPATPSR